MKQLLPIGSVVRLKGGTKYIMICGRIQEREEDHQVFDYSACLYPEGILNSEEMYLFDHDSLDEVIYLGYIDIHEQILQKQIIDYMMNGDKA